MRYRLDPTGPGDVAVLAAAREQVVGAAEAIAGAPADPDAIHSARKRLKKARAALRLLRPDHRELRRAVNALLRDAARVLAAQRDLHVMQLALDHRYPNHPGHAGADAVLKATPQPPDASRERAAVALPMLDAAIHSLDPAPLETQPSDDGSAALEANWKRTCKRARKAWRLAHEQPEAPEALHDLRKRLKDLWYHARLLRGRVGKRGKMRRWSRRTRGLTELLGDHNDLTMLRNALAVADATAHAELIERIDRDRAKLAAKALKRCGKMVG